MIEEKYHRTVVVYFANQTLKPYKVITCNYTGRYCFEIGFLIFIHLSSQKNILDQNIMKLKLQIN